MATNGLNLQTSGLTFTTGQEVRGIITNLGRYGVGTLLPEAALHVVPTGTTDSVKFEGLSSSSTETNYLVADSNGVLETRNDVVTLAGTQTLTNKTINGSQLVDGSVANAKLTNDDLTITAGNGLTDGGLVALGSSVTLNVGAGTGIVVNSNDVALDYAGTNNFIESATNLEGTAISDADTIIYHDATDNNVKKGLVSDLPFSNNSGTVTSVAIAGTDGIDVDSGSPITTSGTITLGLSNVPNSSLANSSITLAGDSGSSQTVSLGDTLTIAGGTGLSSVAGATDTVTINLDDTAVTPGSYGSASETVTFTVDAQGRLTSASEQSISITASQISDFATASETAIFQSGNFVDSTEIDFTVTAGASVTAAIKSTSIANSKLVNDDLTVTAGGGLTGGGLVALGGSITISHADTSSVSNVNSDNSNGTVIQDVTLGFDTYGHVTGATVGTANLDNRYYSFRTINVPTGTDPAAESYNDTLNLISSDNSVVISGNSSSDTIDIKVASTVDSFVTGATLSSGTLTLTLNNSKPNVTASGFGFTIAGDSGSSTRNLGQTVTIAGGTYTNTTESSGTVTVDLDTAATLFTVTADSGSNQAITPGNTLDIAGGTGLSTVVGSTDTVTINLDDTAVTPGSYGSASETVTFTVDAQGRLTAASEQTISITSSEVSDFATASENAIFQAGNFVNSVGAGGINFVVVAGSSVSASLVNDDLTVTAGNGLTDGGLVALGSSVTLNVGAGTGIVVNSNDVALDYAGTDNFIDSATNLEGTAISTSDTIIYHDATDNNVKKGLVSDLPFSNNSGTVTSVAIAGTDGIDVDSGSPITTSGTITLGLSNVPNSSLQNSSVTVTAGSGLSGGGSVSLGGSVSVSHADTSSVANVTSNNANGTVIQDVTLGFDTFGHVTGATVGTANLDNRYYTETESDARYLAFRTINVPTGTDPVADAYNDTLNFISSDSSVVISGNSTSDTIDIKVASSVDTNIYNTDGTLSGTRTVTQAGNALEFTGGDFKVDGTTFNVIDGTNSVAIGSNTADASAVLEVASTTKGFLFPRMTQSQRIAIATPATGLMVYQTDAAEGVYIYKSFGWVQVI